jgi:GDP-mannose 6-dehydrogenase
MTDAVKNVAVFGLGYVGCVTAACLSRDGFRVTGVDLDAAKVDQINRGDAPVSEPGLEALIRQALSAQKLRAVRDVQEAIAQTDLALVAVGTPSADSGAVDTRAVARVIEEIGKSLRNSQRRYTVVVRSTLLPGILEEQLAPALARGAGADISDRIFLCNNPEFLRESTAIRDYDQPPFVLVGAQEEWQAQSVLDLYERVEADKIATDTRTAALVKYASNAYHALKVAFGNEIGTVARSFGANGHKVMDLVCRDRKLNVSAAYLKPGFAFGGSCLPKDLRALVRHAEEHALQLPLLPAVLASNENHVRRAVRIIEQSTHRRLGIVGLTFKDGTDDLRESPQVVLAETLLGKGYDLRIYDPNIQIKRLHGRNLAYADQHLKHLAALLVATPEELFDHSSMLILGTNVADKIDLRFGFKGEIFDLRRDLAQPQSTTVKV